MENRINTYYYMPNGLEDLDKAKLQARIKTYYPDTIFLSKDELGIFHGKFPSGLLNENFNEECRILLNTTYEVSKQKDEFIYFYKELYKKNIFLSFYRFAILNTENIIEICKLFKSDAEINAHDIERVITLQFEIFENERKNYSIEKRDATKEARRLMGLTGEDIENEQRKKKAIESIKRMSATFGGPIDNEKLYKQLKIGRNTLYRYIKEIKNGDNK